MYNRQTISSKYRLCRIQRQRYGCIVKNGVFHHKFNIDSKEISGSENRVDEL